MLTSSKESDPGKGELESALSRITGDGLGTEHMNEFSYTGREQKHTGKSKVLRELVEVCSINKRFRCFQTVVDPLMFLPSAYTVVLLRQVTS